MSRPGPVAYSRALYHRLRNRFRRDSTGIPVALRGGGNHHSGVPPMPPHVLGSVRRMSVTGLRRAASATAPRRARLDRSALVRSLIGTIRRLRRVVRVPDRRRLPRFARADLDPRPAPSADRPPVRRGEIFLHHMTLSTPPATPEEDADRSTG